MINPHLPQPSGLRCRQTIIDAATVTIVVATMTPTASCPLCGRPSSRIHSRYTRALADLPWQGRVAQWRLEVRKFFCDKPACPRRIFSERLPDVAEPYARQTIRLNEALTSIAFACGGERGSRLANDLRMPTSPDALLRRIRRSPSSSPSALRIVGVDDWALRRGQRYGTLLCDLERHCPMDVLDGHEAETVATWLQRHPGIDVITRDRTSCYYVAVRPTNQLPPDSIGNCVPIAPTVDDYRVTVNASKDVRHGAMRRLETRHGRLGAK